MVRAYGKNARRKNCEENVQKYTGRKKAPLESQESDVKNYLKKMYVRGWRNVAWIETLGNVAWIETLGN